jgi:hypothetical protein
MRRGGTNPGAMALIADEDVRFEHRWHRVQRVGRAILVVCLVAAVLGIFGTGPLASATARAPGGSFSVDYDRFLRTTQSTDLEISAQATHGPATVAVAQSYLDTTGITGVSPQPDSETARGDRVVLTWQGSLPDDIELQVAPQTIGVHRATIWVAGTPVRFRQVTWP